MRHKVRCRDRTTQFQAAVERLERADPLLGVASGGRDPQRILRRVSLRGGLEPLESLARDIVANTTRLKEFLLDHRSDYVDVVRAAWSGQCGLTHQQKDHIDAGANRFIRTCQGLITKFQRDLDQSSALSGERRSHLAAVGQILAGYLKAVCRIYAQQQAIRVQRELEFQKLARLEIKARKSSESQPRDSRRLESDLLSRLGHSSSSSMDSSDEEATSESSPKRRKSEDIPLTASSNYPEEEEEVSELTPDEIQMFEQENAQLYQDFMQVKDSVHQIQNKVVKIAELQDVFTEKVLQQKGDIDLVHHHAVSTTENVKDANEELRKAIQNQASIRVYILFFLLMMSFSLLFLDWYSE
eukprot:maker-scaffold156_size297567-snap-gene-0.20 protein:Tk07662 transcript:maker-scaffold156_size297567-snap-gene-0.20-mRNA-1 annotation:"syntaxin-18 isoform x1"